MTCDVPTPALNTSVQGQLPVAVYDTQPVAASLVVNDSVAPVAVRFEPTMLVMVGATVSGASGPPPIRATPARSVAEWFAGESSAVGRAGSLVEAPVGDQTGLGTGQLGGHRRLDLALRARHVPHANLVERAVVLVPERTFAADLDRRGLRFHRHVRSDR